MFAPPTALISGYYLWYSGQQFVMTRCPLPSLRFTAMPSSQPPPQTLGSYTAGLITVGGTYFVLEHLIQQTEVSGAANNPGTTTSSPRHVIPHKAPPHQAFQPPQTIEELIQRLGPPLLSRLGALSFSFFCAGAVQTYVAAHLETMMGW